jgi:hypothetical protein
MFPCAVPLCPVPLCPVPFVVFPFVVSDTSGLLVAIAMYLSYYCTHGYIYPRDSSGSHQDLSSCLPLTLVGRRSSFGLCAFILSVHLGQCAT